MYGMGVRGAEPGFGVAILRVYICNSERLQESYEKVASQQLLNPRSKVIALINSELVDLK